MNQYTNPVPASYYDEYMARGSHRGVVHRLEEIHNENPQQCQFHMGRGEVWLRTHGKRHKFTMRQLLYYVVKGTVGPLEGRTCGNPECINPLHQVQGKAVPKGAGSDDGRK